MCPLELTATPAASPRCISGGSFRRCATESYGISGGDCCAIADNINSIRSPTSPRFMVISLNRGQRYCEDDIFSRDGSSIQTGELATQSHRRVFAHRCGSQQIGEQHMRYVDAFNHFFPGRIYELLLQSPAGQKDLGKRMRGIPALSAVAEGARVVETFPDYSQVICLGMPAIDRLAGPAESPERARIGNDGLPELRAKHAHPFLVHDS